MRHVTSSMRQIAGKVLAAWLASWMLVVLQPCCEAVASSLAHHHVQTQGEYSGHHADDEDVIPAHQHCKTDVTNVSDLSAPISEQLRFNHPKPELDQQGGWQVFAGELTLTRARSSPLSISHHPPPSHPVRVYLKTQRIRI